MISMQACLVLAVFAANLSASNGNPFQIFKRHFIPGLDESPRQGRNSKLMNFGAGALKSDLALPLSLKPTEDEDTTEEEVEAVEDNHIQEDKIADVSLIELEDAATEIMINNLLAKTIEEQEDRGGKEYEDEVGITGGQADFTHPEEVLVGEPEIEFVAPPSNIPAQSPVYQFKQQAPGPVAYPDQYRPYPGQQQQQQFPTTQQQKQQPSNYYPEQYQQQQQYPQQQPFRPPQQFQQQQFQPQQYQQQQGYARRPYGNAQPRSTGLSSDFGLNMGADAIAADPDNNLYPNQPQLEVNQVELRQNDGASSEAPEPSSEAPQPSSEAPQASSEAPQPSSEAPQISTEAAVASTDREDVRCINKVMQVEETVYEERIKCQHTFTEKCHDTFITDYVPTQEKKCETSFKKNCHITYKPMMFEEDVEVCNEPLRKVCNDDTVGPEVCQTNYETVCETRYKEHEVEQDEPVCEMVIERKCNGVTVPLPSDGTNSPAFRNLVRGRRQAPAILDGEVSGNDLNSDLGFLQSQDFATIGEKCEDWPIQKCRLEKRIVKKTNPETSCEKIPREVCAPSNCIFEKSEQRCRQETRNLVQNIPSEQCDLEPQENCKMETVLVPRLIQQPNCIKVPKEVCVNAKTNPRKVKKPVIKEWCYRPSDLQSPSSRLALTQFFRQ